MSAAGSFSSVPYSFFTVNYNVHYYGGKLKRSAITHTLFFPKEEDIGYFQIDAVSGELRTTQSLSYAERSDYRMMVTARDQGTPSLQGHAAVHIQVLIYVEGENSYVRYLVTLKKEFWEKLEK